MSFSKWGFDKIIEKFQIYATNSEKFVGYGSPAIAHITNG
jgi:hypothetical protein